MSLENKEQQELDAVENWRGLATGSKKRGRSSYLAPSCDWLLPPYESSSSMRKLSILKNGQGRNLKSVKVGKEDLSLSNTSALDAIL